MALSRRKEVVTKQVDEINYSDLSDAVEELLSTREGRKVDIRDYAGIDAARRLAFIETNKLGDMSWFGTQFTKFTEVQKKQHDIYRSFIDGLPYMDFWHWWLDKIDEDVSNDTTNEIDWSGAFEQEVEELETELAELSRLEAEGNDVSADKAMAEFILTVLKAFNEVLLTIYTQDELDGMIEIHYSW